MQADIIIVGGGASGIFAAAVLAELSPEVSVLVFEKGSRPLEKVRISGGGRCNLTHECDAILDFVKNYPRGGSELIGPFHRFGPAETIEWFESHSVPLVILPDGCLFPKSDTSEDIIAALLNTVACGNQQIQTRAEVSSVRKTACGFELELSDGRRASCWKLLVATGGGAFLAGLGHTIEPCVPALFTFCAEDRELTSLAGIVIDPVRVSAAGLKADGALLITHRGVSGPAVLRLSSFGARSLADVQYRFEMKINWLPGQTEEQLVQSLVRFREKSPHKQVCGWSPVGLPSRLWKLLTRRAGVDAPCEWGQCSLKSLRRIVTQATGFTLPISGKDPNRDEFVTCGGVRLAEINFQTMESRLMPDLYFAGEVLDIDALTGGFNLQAAWTTGWLAAHGLSRVTSN